MPSRSIRTILSAAALAAAAAPSALAQPANDLCSSALSLPIPGTVTGSNVGATGTSVCSGLNDVWWLGVANRAGRHTFNTLGSGLFDTTIAAYDSCDGLLLACNNDTTDSAWSSIDVQLTAGQPVHVAVAGWFGDQGAITLTAIEPPVAPTNDLCGSAATLAIGSTVAGTTVNATGEDVDNCVFRDANDVWYAVTAPAAGLYRFQTAPVGGSPDFDTSLTAYDFCGGFPLTCDDDSGTGLASRIFLNLAAGQQVLIRVAADETRGATSAFTIAAELAPAPPANDLCESAAPFALPGTTAGTNADATGDQTVCGFSSDTADVWFTAVAPESGFYLLRTTGALDTTVAVYDACGGLPLRCGNNQGADLNGRAIVPLVAGQQVLVRVAGESGATGGFTLVASPASPPANDECAAAALSPVPGAGGVVVGTFEQASPSAADVPCSDDEAFELDAFHTFTPNGVGPWELRMCDLTTNLDGIISIHTACPTTPADTVAGGCDAGGCGLFGPGWIRSVRLVNGQTYIIRVAAFVDPDGNTVADQPYGFRVTDLNIPTPANDQCAGAASLAPGAEVIGSTKSANNDIAAAACGGNDADVWYTLTNASASRTSFTLDAFRTDDLGSSYPDAISFAVVSVYASCSGPELACGSNNSNGVGGSRVSFIAEAGQTVLVRVAGIRGIPYVPDEEAGRFRLRVSSGVAVPSTPANDLCANATPVAALPFQDTQSIFSATNDPDTTCNFHDNAALGTVGGVWYTYTAPSTGYLEVRSSNTLGSNSPVAFFTGACGGAQAQVACVSPVSAATSRFVLVEGGTTYRILVGSPSDSSPPLNAAVSLSLLSLTPVPPAPVNDECQGAVVIAASSLLSPYVDQRVVVSADDDAPPSCVTSGAARSGVWYAFTAPADGRLVVRETGAADGRIGIYSGDCDFLAEIACENFSTNDQASAQVSAGATYRILVGRSTPPEGPTQTTDVRVTFFPVLPPVNDSCGLAQALTGANFAAAVDTSTAFNEGPSDAPSGTCNNTTTGLRNSIYYTFTAASNGRLTGTIDPSLANYRALVAVYSGECGATLTSVACLNGFSALNLDVPVVAGTRYTVQIGTRGTAPSGGVTTIVLSGPFSCPADFNGSGTRDVADIFAFLSAWFASGPGSDFNNSGTRDVADIFAFLSAWFAGC